MQAHLFEPFFTTKDLGKGTGLGLATVYGIVKQNDGLINVVQRAGPGTTFKIHLPPPPGAHGVAIAGEARPSRRTRTRDGPRWSKTNRPSCKFDLPHARSARLHRAGGRHRGEAVCALRGAQQAGIHLLITDVVMPEMNGRALAEEISRHPPDLKTPVHVRLHGDVIAHHGVLEEGVQFIQKPFSKGGVSC